MHECTDSYDEMAMLGWLKKSAFTHIGDKTHKVMQFLQEASHKVDKKSGIWTLWESPLTIELAEKRLPMNVPGVTKVKKEVTAEQEFKTMEVDEEQFIRQENLRENVSRTIHNLDETLENKERSKDDRIDESLSPHREGAHARRKFGVEKDKDLGFNTHKASGQRKVVEHEVMIVEQEEVMIPHQEISAQFEN